MSNHLIVAKALRDMAQRLEDENVCACIMMQYVDLTDAKAVATEGVVEVKLPKDTFIHNGRRSAYLNPGIYGMPASDPVR